LLSNAPAEIKKLGVTDLVKLNVVTVLLSVHDSDRLIKGASLSDGVIFVRPADAVPVRFREKPCVRPIVPPSV
jgi:hypothetical protein